MKKLIVAAMCMMVAGIVHAQNLSLYEEREIRSRAETRWPNDFSMQAYEIKKQTDAFYNLVQYRPSGIDYTTLDQIKQMAVKKWPGDYSMQLYETKKQAEAWLQLNGR